MSAPVTKHVAPLTLLKQRGVVLFLTLVALLAMSLAAVALIRSVDTSTLIAGNLAFKQAATSSGDAGIEAGITWLTTMQAANAGLNVFTDSAHPFNSTSLAARPGYHSNVDPALDLTAPGSWAGNNSALVGTDATGNTVRYMIHRMCRNADLPIANVGAGCLLGIDPTNPNPTNIPLPSEICEPTPTSPCPPAGRSPMYRITARVEGLKNSVSYVQAFVN